jgi:hypothetical protein
MLCGSSSRREGYGVRLDEFILELDAVDDPFECFIGFAVRNNRLFFLFSLETLGCGNVAIVGGERGLNLESIGQVVDHRHIE